MLFYSGPGQAIKQELSSNVQVASHESVSTASSGQSVTPRRCMPSRLGRTSENSGAFAGSLPLFENYGIG